MLVERVFLIKEMVDLLKNYDFSKQCRFLFEYIVFKGVNDLLIYVKELLKLLCGFDCWVNLIWFYVIFGVDFEGVGMEIMMLFCDYLILYGLFIIIWVFWGEDIFVVCGMLLMVKQEESNKN